MLRNLVVVGIAPVLLAVACNPSRAIDSEGESVGVLSARRPIAKETASETTANAAVAAPPSAARGAVAVDPSKLRVEVGRAGMEETDFVQVFGEVHNETGQPIERVKVHVELLDPQGKPLDVTGFHRAAQRDVGAVEEEVAHGLVSHVLPGESTPFHYIRDKKKIQGTYGSFRVRATASPARSAIPVAKVVAPSTSKGELDLVMLKGTFQVGASVPCRSPKAYFGFFDDKGKLTDLVEPHKNALDDWFQKELAPGQTIAFEGKSYPKGGTGARMKTWGACDNH